MKYLLFILLLTLSGNCRDLQSKPFESYDYAIRVFYEKDGKVRKIENLLGEKQGVPEMFLYICQHRRYEGLRHVTHKSALFLFDKNIVGFRRLWIRKGNLDEAGVKLIVKKIKDRKEKEEAANPPEGTPRRSPQDPKSVPQKPTGFLGL